MTGGGRGNCAPNQRATSRGRFRNRGPRPGYGSGGSGGGGRRRGSGGGGRRRGRGRAFGFGGQGWPTGPGQPEVSGELGEHIDERPGRAGPGLT